MTKTAIQWYLVIFKLLAGGGAGMLGLVGLSEFIGTRRKTDFVALIVALLLIIIGGGLAVMSMGQPSRMMAAVRNIPTGSPISLEFLVCGLAVIVGVIYLFVNRRENPVAGKICGVAGILVALAVGFWTGYAHEAMVGTPAWHTHTISLGFLASALLFAVFCYQLIASFGSKKGNEKNGTASAGGDTGPNAGALAGDGSGASGSRGAGKGANNGRDKVFAWIALVLAALFTVIALVHIAKVDLGTDLLVYVVMAPVIGGVCSLVVALGAVFKPMPIWVYLGLLTSLVGGLAFRAFVWIASNPHLLG